MPSAVVTVVIRRPPTSRMPCAVLRPGGDERLQRRLDGGDVPVGHGAVARTAVAVVEAHLDLAGGELDVVRRRL